MRSFRAIPQDGVGIPWLAEGHGIVIGTVWQQPGGLPHQCAHWFAMTVFLLHKQINRQGQQGDIPILPAVAGHQQKQKQNQKIPGVQISGQQAPEEISCRCRSGWGTVGFMVRFFGRRWRRTGRLRRWAAGLGWSWPVRNGIAAVCTVGLRNIAVIHQITCLNRIASLRNAGRLRPNWRFLLPAWLFPVC